VPSDLTARQVNAIVDPGRHRVAANLYLLVDATRRSWVFRYVSPTSGKLRDMGLGPCDIVSIAAARDMALRHRIAIFEGRDPLDERRAGRQPKEASMTFKEVARLCFNAKRSEWRSEKHAAQWMATVEEYAFPVLGNLPIKAIDTAAVMACLEPIWQGKTETASRVRGRIEAILNFASARNWRVGENPARWRGHIENLLARRRKVDIVHLAALPWRELPTLWTDLAKRDGITALALKFCFLTATRTGEVLGATWNEIDLNSRLWTIPKGRMKAGVAHVVPLSEAALDVLDQLAAIRQEGGFLFPGAKAGRPLRATAMQELMTALRPGTTVHGSVRAGFRGWCAAQGVPADHFKAALAHAPGSKVDEAYHRERLLKERAVVMGNWSRFVMTPTTEATVPPMTRLPQEVAAG
jgi:integrase